MEEQRNTPGVLPPMPEAPRQSGQQETSPYPYMAGSPAEAGRQPMQGGEQIMPGERVGAPQGPSQAMPMAQQPIVQPQGLVPGAVPLDNSSQDDTSQNPTVANDVDVIEKEWVERAKAIVEKTRSDPYMQEQKVAEMQSDYLRKRYGKELKVEKV
ncbi:MAG TPA: hypothetical protein VGS28_03785 [Candidatus Saccharimonadales bacterium]|nr:hypothetical protein [Candidatus Saccharimonadales bacterium]